MTEYDNYDLQDEDPYLLSGSTCLINTLGIKDTALLMEAETEISAIAYAELIASTVTPTFDLDHLCTIHHRLFGDIYPWAGSPRERWQAISSLENDTQRMCRNFSVSTSRKITEGP